MAQIIDGNITYHPNMGINRYNVVEKFPYLTKEKQLQYFELYQEVLKEQFEENKRRRYENGDYSYIDQKIQSQEKYKEDKKKARVGDQSSGESNIFIIAILALAGILFIK